MKPAVQCLDDNTTQSIFEGRLGAEAWLEVDSHVDGCPPCRELIAHISLCISPQRRAGTDGERLEGTTPVPRGTTVGRFVVEDVLGRGGMGVVYAARDPELGRQVALKLIDSPRGELTEARALARLQHPNVVTLYDAGHVDGRLYLAMELHRGATLREWLLDGRREVARVLEVFRLAGAGLAAAHRAGIVHRDFKPDNVLLESSIEGLSVKVSDFGLARLSGAEPLQRVGTLAYMAPEQRHGHADERADQYSFCMSLYEALLGQLPAGESVDANWPRSLPGRMRRAIMRGLSKNPADRFASLDELLRALAPRPRANRIALGLAIGAALLAVVLAGVVASSRERCSGAQAQLGAIWGPSQRAASQAAFAATKFPSSAEAWRRVEQTLSDYSRGWAQMHREACEATRVSGTQSDQVLTLRMECLGRRLRELDAAAQTFVGADTTTVEHAADVTRHLTPLGICANVSALLSRARAPENPVLRKRVEAVEATVAQANALLEAGSVAKATALAQQAVDASGPLTYRPLEGEALFALGSAQRANIEYAVAEKTLLASVWAAEAGGDTRQSIESWTLLAMLSGNEQGRVAQGRQYGTTASALLERMGGDARLEAGLLEVLAGIDSVEALFDDERVKHERAIQLFEGTVPSDSLGLARAEVGLGGALLSLNRPAEAASHLNRAVQLFETTEGPMHPDLAPALSNLAISRKNQGELNEAISLLDRALAITEATRSAEHPLIAVALTNKAQTLVDLKRPKEALPLLERALAIRLHEGGAEAVQVAIVRLSMGAVFFELGDLHRALEENTAAVMSMEKNSGPTHPFTGQALLAKGQVLVALNQPRLALDALNAALAISAAQPQGDEEWGADVLFATAKAQWALGEHRDALRAAHHANEVYRRVGGTTAAESQAELASWLARR